MWRSWILPVAILGLSACMVGPSTRSFAPANRPQGIGADLQFRGKNKRIRGEVLEVRNSAIVLLSANRVVLVPIRAIVVGRFSRRGALIQNGRAGQGTLSWLKLVSRFPAGMTPEIRTRLLATYGNRTGRGAVRFVAMMLAASATGAAAQSADFIAQARAGTAPYRDAELARAAGYRPVGPDFPGMGRHWIHPGLILRDTLDPAAPPILEYAEIDGRLTLVGVAYAKLVHDATPPAGLPVPATAWHFHQGTVEEESFLRSHARLAHVAPGREGEARIAVLHAWIWLENPDGLLATDNWALPYSRLGYRAPPGPSQEAGRALALAAGDGGRNYVEALLRAIGRPSAAEEQALAQLVERHQAAVRALLPGDAKTLAHCWAALLQDVRLAVRPEVWERLQVLQ